MPQEPALDIPVYDRPEAVLQVFQLLDHLPHGIGPVQRLKGLEEITELLAGLAELVQGLDGRVLQDREALAQEGVVGTPESPGSRGPRRGRPRAHSVVPGAWRPVPARPGNRA